MDIHKTKKRIIPILCLFLMLCMMTSLSLIKAEDKKVIRVGYPIQDGLTMKDEEGNYYGYTYDYLSQLAQYTGWRFEYVEVKGDLNKQLSTLMEMLSKGEIDLLGSMRYNDALAEMYDYPSEPYGNAYNVILANDDSDLYDQSSLFNKKDLKIAVYETAVARIEKLDQFAEMNGFSYTKVYAKSSEEITELVDQGKADVILSVDLDIPKGYHAIARFSPDAFYFATTKGNTGIVSELSQAITDISRINPLFTTTLYNRYFTSSLDTIRLNSSEEAFVQSHNTIHVLVKGGYAPIEDVRDGEPCGVGKDILDRIKEQTGLKFEYTIADTYEEYDKLLKQEHFDLLMGLSYDVDKADEFNVALTSPYLTTNLVLVTQKDMDPNHLEGGIQGVTYYNSTAYDTNVNLKYYESAEAIMDAIEHEEVDYTYMDSYQVTYYMNKLRTSNITSFALPEYLRSQVAFGVRKSEDLSLMSIMNKAIRTLDDTSLNSFIYKNAYIEDTFSLQLFFQTYLPQTIFVVILLVVILISGLFMYYRHQLKMKQVVELEYQRYQSLSMITGEMTFEYHYLKDQLKISNGGIGKIAHTGLIDQFSKEAGKQEINEHKVLAVLQLYLDQKKDTNVEVLIHMADGSERWYQLVVKIIRDVGKNRPLYAIGKVLDIQKQILEKEQLKKESFTDPLTGIYNRLGGTNHIQAKLQEEDGALIMIDLDKFKNVNDQFGHFAGDEVLQESAKLLQSIFHDGIVSRFGGDEFLVYVSTHDKEVVTALCQEALCKVRQLNCMKKRKIEVSMSMGIVFTHQGDDVHVLMKKADHLLYDSKRQGRNMYHIYENKTMEI